MYENVLIALIYAYFLLAYVVSPYRVANLIALTFVITGDWHRLSNIPLTINLVFLSM